MKVAVFGATGRTGRRVVERALDDGHHVTGIARTPSKLDLQHESLDVEQGDVLDYESFADLLHGRDVVVSTVGKESYLSRVSLYSEGITNIVRAMEEHEGSRLIAITSGGTYPGWDRNNATFYEAVIQIRGGNPRLQSWEEADRVGNSFLKRSPTAHRSRSFPLSVHGRCLMSRLSSSVYGRRRDSDRPHPARRP